MKSEGIYVEIPIHAAMDDLWQHTQNPALHQQWDLRFTTIEYLPKQSEEEPRRFLYETQVGFGIKVSGEGESTGTRHTPDGQCTSALRFWSDEPISLIRSGSGYWKYVPDGKTIRFLTWYDYQVRFGTPGRLFDRLVFRPLLGWATAWSFDALRLWLERGLHPAQSIRRALIHLTVQFALAAIWVYQGLVPKLLFPDSGELQILRAMGIFDGMEPTILAVVGVGEIVFGILFLVPRLGERLHYLNMIVLLVLGLGAFLSQKALFVAPFNPVALTLATIALSLIGILNREDVPTARNCLRRRSGK
jgi:hypothetical protein